MIMRRIFNAGKIICTVHLMNKIPIKNIYYMLAYAFTNLKFDDIKNISAEKFENIYNLFAAILSESIGKLLKQGIYREYINHSENLSTVRGKINLSNTIQNFFAGRRKIFCEFDELSENNLFNRILKKRELYFFANVEEIRIDLIRRENLHYQKHYSQLKPQLKKLCKKFFGNICAIKYYCEKSF